MCVGRRLCQLDAALHKDEHKGNSRCKETLVWVSTVCQVTRMGGLEPGRCDALYGAWWLQHHPFSFLHV